MTLFGRALKGSIAAATGTGLTIMQAVVGVPVLLTFWTDIQYGDWVLLTAATAILVTIDVGYHAYVGNVLNRLWIVSRHQFNQCVHLSLIISRLLAVVQGLGIVVIALLKGNSFFGSSSVEYGLILWSAFWITNGSVAGIFAKVYIPIGEYARAQWIGNIGRLLGFIGVVFAAILGGGVLAALSAQLIISAFVNWWTIKDLKRYLPDLFASNQKEDLRSGWRRLTESFHFTINGLLDQLSFNGTTLIIKSSSTSTEVAVFTTLRTLTNTALQGAAVLLAPLSADLARYHVLREGSKVRSLFSVSWFAANSLTCSILILVLPFVEELYVLWTRGRLDCDIKLLVSLGAGVVVRQWCAPLQGYVSAINLLKLQSIAALARACSVLGLALFALKDYGLLAVGLGLVLGEVLAAGILASGTCRELRGLGTKLPLRSAALSLIQVCSFCIAAFYFSTIQSGWSAILILCLIVCLSSAFAQWRSLDVIIRSKITDASCRVFGL